MVVVSRSTTKVLLGLRKILLGHMFQRPPLLETLGRGGGIVKASPVNMFYTFIVLNTFLRY